jgi:hypothetical protein
LFSASSPLGKLVWATLWTDGCFGERLARGECEGSIHTEVILGDSDETGKLANTAKLLDRDRSLE